MSTPELTEDQQRIKDLIEDTWASWGFEGFVPTERDYQLAQRMISENLSEEEAVEYALRSLR